jgi:hypothetical protein
MNPELPQPKGSVMDIQPTRPNPAPSQVGTPLDNPMAPADSITGMTPDPGQVTGQTPLQQTVKPPKEKKNRTGLIIGIVTAAVVVMTIAAVGGFILYKNSNKPTPAASDTQSESERVNVEEIDKTISEIDKTLNTMNDSSDITPNDLSDNTLGL